MLPSEGPLSPPLNGDSDSPLPFNGSCTLPGKTDGPQRQQSYTCLEGLFVCVYNDLFILFISPPTLHVSLFLSFCLWFFLPFFPSSRAAHPSEEASLVSAGRLHVGELHPLRLAVRHAHPSRPIRYAEHAPAPGHSSPRAAGRRGHRVLAHHAHPHARCPRQRSAGHTHAAGGEHTLQRATGGKGSDTHPAQPVSYSDGRGDCKLMCVCVCVYVCECVSFVQH